MASGYSRSPKLLKGALIQFSAPLLIPIPNIIIFQYNPETMSRSFTPWSPPPPAANQRQSKSSDPKQDDLLSQPFDPEETFDLALELDAADALEEPGSHPVAVISGVADRIAAMEMLLYPPEDSALGGLLSGALNVSVGSGGIGASLSGKASSAITVAERKEVPIVLFFWGPGRIVPVRITSFSVEEQAYSPILYPIQAKVKVGLKILDALTFAKDTRATAKIAKACYTFTRTQKQALATANLANSVESIMGMLPF
jgi:hypothetical protein